MKRKNTLKQVLLVSLATIMLLAAAGCGTIKDLAGGVKSKAEFVNAMKKIEELDRKVESGDIENDTEKYSEKEYGKFVGLIEAEKKYYIALDKKMKSFEEDSQDFLMEDLAFDKPEDTETLRKAADKLDTSLKEYLDTIKKLNEDNLKEIEGLDIPKDYKEIYLDAKKKVDKSLDKYIDELNKSAKVLVSGLKEMADILDKAWKAEDESELDEYLERLEEIAEEMEKVESSVNDIEEDFNKDIENINKELVKKAEEL